MARERKVVVPVEIPAHESCIARVPTRVQQGPLACAGHFGSAAVENERIGESIANDSCADPGGFISSARDDPLVAPSLCLRSAYTADEVRLEVLDAAFAQGIHFPFQPRLRRRAREVQDKDLPVRLPEPRPVGGRIPALIGNQILRMFRRQRVEFADSERRFPDPQIEPQFPQFPGKPFQPMREPVVLLKGAGEMPFFPSQVNFHDAQSQRAQSLYGDARILQDPLFRHAQPVGIPATPRDGGCRRQFHLVPALHALGVTLQETPRVRSRQKNDLLQVQRFTGFHQQVPAVKPDGPLLHGAVRPQGHFNLPPPAFRGLEPHHKRPA